jgi:hypothetical protein
MTEVTTFEEALEASKEAGGNRHLLLGNGFSIACRPDSFSYGNLFDEPTSAPWVSSRNRFSRYSARLISSG